MLLAASQRAFWLRPPAISRRDMMTGGGSAVKRLIFGITAAGAAIAGARQGRHPPHWSCVYLRFFLFRRLRHTEQASRCTRVKTHPAPFLSASINEPRAGWRRVGFTAGTPRTPPRSNGDDRETAHNVAMAEAGSSRILQEITNAIIEQSGDDFP